MNEQTPKLTECLGYFQITRELLVSQIDEDLLEKVFSGIFVVRCEYIFTSTGEEFNYTAMSRHFRSIDGGSMIPIYKCEITTVRNDDGDIIDHYIEWKEWKS